MKPNQFAHIIADLLIDPEDSDNPHPEHNAYNWGLIDAQRAFQGVSVDVIKEYRPK